MAEYEVLISTFPGGTPPDSFDEFIRRVESDPGITTPIMDPKWRYKVHDTGPSQSIVVISDPALTVPEEAIVDGLAAAPPDEETGSIAGWISEQLAPRYRGMFENRGVPTATTRGPVVRQSDSQQLAGGRYEVKWHGELDGTKRNTMSIARFVFDRGGPNEFIDTYGPAYRDEIFAGSTEIVVDPGTYSFELELERDTGPGASLLSDSSIQYVWRGVS